MSHSQFIGYGSAQGRIWIGGVDWEVEVEFHVTESDLNIREAYYLGHYVNDELKSIEPIMFDPGELDDRSYDQITQIISDWLEEAGYDREA